MAQLNNWRVTKTRLALLGLAILGCCVVALFWFAERGSPEQKARSHYERGVKLVDQQDYAKAAIELRNALRLKNNMLTAWQALAKVEEATKNWDGLIQSLQSVVGLAPSDFEARVKLIKLLALRDRVYQALDLINTDSETESQSATLLGLKAAILYKLNDKGGAIREAQRALAIDPGNADALVVLANDRMASGDLQSALRVLGNDAPINNTDLGIQLLRLKILEQLGETRRLEALLQQLAKQHPNNGIFRRQLIKFYINQHRTDDAESEARVLVEENPTNSEVQLDLVRLLYVAKGPAAAREELIARINAGGEIFPYQIALADFDFSQGNFSEAEQQIRNLTSHASSKEQI